MNMSRLDELIRELCPDGVEYKTLGEIGTFYGGITGKTKDDFVDGNAKFITYKNVYMNPSLNLNLDDKVKIADGENQRTLEYADIIFTGSSETPSECGISSVVTEQPTEPLYLNSFCFVFKFNNPNIMLPNFSKHLFRSDSLRYQIGRTASGVTRYNVSKKLMAKVKIPVPPLPVQQEIVRILDTFTALTAELTAELTARKKQYEYYRDRLLHFDEDEVQWKKLGHVVTIERGTRLVRNQLNDNEQYPVFQNALTPLGYYREYNREPNNTFMICAGAAGQIGFSDIHFWAADDCYTFKCCDNLNNKFLFHVLKNNQHNIDNKVRKASIPRISREAVGGIKIPIPPLEIQNRIVSILDRFDSLCNDLSSGLPAEIEARRKQYEYYRDRLLTFKEKKG